MPVPSVRIRTLVIAALLTTTLSCDPLTGPGASAAGRILMGAAEYTSVPEVEEIYSLNMRYRVRTTLTIANATDLPLLIDRCEGPNGPVPRMSLVLDDAARSATAYQPPNCTADSPLLIPVGRSVGLEYTFWSVGTATASAEGWTFIGRMRARASSRSGVIESAPFELAYWAGPVAP